MSADFDPLGLDDARLYLEPGAVRDCFVCAKKVYPNREKNDPHFVSGPTEIKLAAHGSCLNGRTPFDISTRYQKALWAALMGKKERT